mgnify:CR=1 FL=1
MAYGMNQLRKAGQALRTFDDNYADSLWNEDAPELFQIGHILSLGNIGEQTSFLNNKTATAALAGANFASRYALPAGGATLAGLGIANLGNSMRQAFAPTAEEAMDYASQFEEAGMPEYAAQMRAAAGVQTSSTLMP